MASECRSYSTLRSLRHRPNQTTVYQVGLDKYGENLVDSLEIIGACQKTLRYQYNLISETVEAAPEISTVSPSNLRVKAPDLLDA